MPSPPKLHTPQLENSISVLPPGAQSRADVRVERGTEHLQEAPVEGLLNQRPKLSLSLESVCLGKGGLDQELSCTKWLADPLCSPFLQGILPFSLSRKL